MNPAMAQAVIQLVLAIIAASPSIVEGVKKAIDAIDALFAAKVIDAATQNSAKRVADGLAAAAELGIPPSAWQVKPDPV